MSSLPNNASNRESTTTSTVAERARRERHVSESQTAAARKVWPIKQFNNWALSSFPPLLPCPLAYRAILITLLEFTT
jgi:hypothetical protein